MSLSSMFGGMSMGGSSGKAPSPGGSDKSKAKKRSDKTAGLTMPKAEGATPNDNTWSNSDASTFSLRVGPNYEKNKQKAPSGKALMELVGVDCVRTDAKIDNIGAKMKIPEEWKTVDTTLAKVPGLFIVNFQIPSEFPTTIFKEITDGPGWSVVFYFRMTPETAAAMANLPKSSAGTKLFSKYCTEAPDVDSDPNSPWRGRFKITVRCDNIDEFGLPSFITSYNAKPVLIRKNGNLIRGDGYIEMDVNVHKFGSIPKQALQVLLNRFDKMYINIGFCIESREDAEMPEVLFGCACLNKPSINVPEW